MTLYSKEDLSAHPSWYWAPYVYGLGLADWWQEVVGKKHKEVLIAGICAAKKNKHRIFRLFSSMILVFLLYVFIAKWLIAPAVMSGDLTPSSQELLWWTGALAFFSIAFIASRLLFGLKRHFSSMHRRGLAVLRSKGESLHKVS